MFDYLPILPLKPSWKKDEKRMKELSAKIHDICKKSSVIIIWRNPTKDAPDLGESSASDSESNPAPKRVI